VAPAGEEGSGKVDVRVLLISANTERINMPAPPLGLGLVATATRQAGHEVTFLDLLSEPAPDAAVRSAIEAASPEVIGISVRNIDDQDIQSRRFLLEPVKDLVFGCRACTDAPIVLGGAGYSMFPDAALTYLGADLGICGEGELAFPALLERLQHGQDPSGLPGVHVAGRGSQAGRQFAPDLDCLPLPDDSLWLTVEPTTPDLWVPVQTRRGCGLDCTYCSTASIEGRAVRARSPQLIVEHIRRVASAGFARFYFVDNTFNLPLSHAMELCRRIAAERLNVEWRCILYPHQVPEALVAAMADAGCVEVSLGFESGSKDVLRALNKQFEPEEVRRISDLLAKHGIRRLGFLLLGGPGETRESVKESLAFADSLGLEMLKVSVGIRIYPRTALAKIALEEGVISADDDLLFPRFYLRPDLEGWIFDVVPSQLP
jgi:radical SAM superfamily enzyme YgiQ (UPF0313 family)